MRKAIRFAYTVPAISVLLGLATGCHKENAGEIDEIPVVDIPLPNAPEQFEPLLQKEPANEGARSTAIKYYVRPMNLERLRHHTLQMARYYPANSDIEPYNRTAFHAHPHYRQEVADALETQLKKRSHIEVEHYFTLGSIYHLGAFPPPKDREGRQRFKKFYHLPPETVLPTEFNYAQAEKSIYYYSLAVKAAKENKGDPVKAFYIGFSAEHLANVLRRTGALKESIAVCEDALPLADDISKPGLLLAYGRCLKKAGKITKAKQSFKKIRKIDQEWMKGPGSTTMQAEAALGLLALEEKDVKQAARYLLSSTKVETYNFTGWNGLPYNFLLAQKLLEAGQRETVIQYCRAMLSRFRKDNKELNELLQKATKAQREAKT